MTKQIREYLEQLQLFLDGEHSRDEYVQEMKRLHVRIGFFSHERLVHMFIMLSFAIFFLMTLFMALIQGSIGIYVLALLFLVGQQRQSCYHYPRRYNNSPIESYLYPTS